MTNICLGPAGLGGNSLDGIGHIRRLKLNCAEVEFTYGVRMSNQLAKEVGKEAKKQNISLSVHGPYYINLGSKEKIKTKQSKQRILDSCERAHHLGAKNVVFHAGFYQGRNKEEVYNIIKEGIIDLQRTIRKNNWDVDLALETTGKKSQFGDLDELLKLRKEVGCSLCVDFAHILAREGKIDLEEVFNKLKLLKYIHSHFSGIEYTANGERRHLITEEKDIIPLAKEILKRKVDITIINESPDPIRDSLKTKKVFERLGYKF